MDLYFFMFVIDIIITLLCMLLIIRIATQPDRSYEPPNDRTDLPLSGNKPTKPDIPDDSSKDPVVRIRNSMVERNIDPKYEKLAETYLRNMKTSFQNIFMVKRKKPRTKIEMVVPNTDELSRFGSGLLSLYLLDNSKTEYLKIVEDLIVKIDEKLDTVKKHSQPLLFIPWYDNWYYYSVSLNRMFAMYEYIGNNKKIKDICHRRIIQITPILDKSLGYNRNGINLVYLGIPRLLTNYLYNRPLYDSEIKSKEFKNMSRHLNIIYNLDTVINDGLYEDYSCICHSELPNFAYQVTVGVFYINVYRSLGFKANVSNIVEKIFDKTIHKKLDFVGYGLYNRDPRITCNETLNQYWPFYKRSSVFDVSIFPFMGLGVFKSGDFIFSVRVQRNGLAAYEFDRYNQQFALGWIQMRKLYLVGVDYDSYNEKMEWNDLKLQPGVISFADDRNNKFDNFYTLNPNEVTRRFCEEIKSFIGHLKNHNNRKLLYWSNKYKFSAFYGPNVEIRENGVCTDNGLVMRHEINNNSGKELKLIMKDKDIGGKMKFKSFAADSGTEISIPSGGAPVIVNWSQLFNENIEPTTVDWDKANNSMSFTFEGDSYSIEQYNKYHIVKCEGKIILAGNSSSLRKNSFTHENKSKNETIHFQRDPETLMYLPQES